MLAAVFRGRNDVRLEERPAPSSLKPGWLTVAVTYCGICGTDIEEITHGPNLVPTSPHPLTGQSLPVTLGHEGTGVVVACGEGVRIEPGTRVALEGTLTCGTCEWCLLGLTQLCPLIAGMGFMLDGALAEAVAVPASMCVPLPKGTPEEAGALAEPLSVAVRAVRRSGGVEGRTVQVVGAGTLGLLVAQVARAQGALAVQVRDRFATRLELARELGLDGVLAEDDARKAQIVFDCGSADSGFESALQATERGGTTVVVAIHPEPARLDLLQLLLEERAVTSVLAHTLEADFVPAVGMLAQGLVQWEPLVTDRVPLERVVADGFEKLIHEPQEHGKILVDCRS
jgi:(R,R)-butanediol dehydrogenase / meso-butanediol dehydrogenase / diacetyl reductase